MALAVGGALAGVAGGVLGNVLSQGDRDKADQARADAVAAFSSLKPPTIEEQMVTLEKLKSAGVLTPELESAILQGNSAMGSVSTDPRLKQAQMQALAQLQATGQSGLNIQDQAALNQINQGVAQQAQGRSGAIMQNMAARGQGGSGAELAAQLSNSQAATAQAQNQGLNVASQAQQRALQAMAQSGQLAGQIQNQDFNQDAAKAQAADAINNFNVQNRQGVSNTNVGAQNAAKQYNLGNQQRIMDTNVGIANQQEMHNKGLYQQQFQNQLARATGMAGQLQDQARGFGEDAAATSGMWSGIGNGLNTGAQSYYNMQNSKNVPPSPPKKS